MHVAGKVFLGLGAVMLVVGGIMTAMGGDTLSDIEWDVEGESIFEGPDGTYTHSSDDVMPTRRASGPSGSQPEMSKVLLLNTLETGPWTGSPAGR